MPAPIGEPLHRYHFSLSLDDHLWLIDQVGERNVARTFRDIIKKLRGESIKSPEKQFRDLLENAELSL